MIAAGRRLRNAFSWRTTFVPSDTESEIVVVLRGEPGKIVADLANIGLGAVFLVQNLEAGDKESLEVVLRAVRVVRRRYEPAAVFHALKGLAEMADLPKLAEKMLECMELLS